MKLFYRNTERKIESWRSKQLNSEKMVFTVSPLPSEEKRARRSLTGMSDITYVDEALYADKLSVVFDDLLAARDTLDRVREFVRSHPTVYMGTHTPQGYENLEAKRVMDLDHPVETVLAEIDFSAFRETGKYVCSVCGYVYDPAEHDGTPFEKLPNDWKCPRCKQGKEKFNRA